MLSSYLQTPMTGYPAASSYRKVIYVLEGILISAVAYAWLEYTQMGGVFKSIYPIIMAVIIVGTQFLMVEFGGRFIQNRWKPFQINIGVFWAISFAGIAFGYLMFYFNAICPGIESLYPDIFYFYTEYPAPTPSRLAVFYKIVLIPWVVSTFLITQGEHKKQLLIELDNIKEINDDLAKKRADTPTHTHGGFSDGDEAPSGDDEASANEHLEIQSTDGLLRIAYEDLYYIAVEDHYCKLVHNRQGKPAIDYVRLSLKEALTQLPSEQFARVHRSYAVNLNQVQHIKKEGQAYQLQIKAVDELIPASRHRAKLFLSRIKGLLRSSHNEPHGG